MPSIIDEIMEGASKDTVSVSCLLRQMLIVSARLGLRDIPAWANAELSGYGDHAEVPAYRVLNGRLMARLFDRLVPAQIDGDFEQSVTTQHLSVPVSEIEHLAASGEEVNLSLSGEQQQVLRDIFRQQGAVFLLVFSNARIRSILDQIRTKIVEWVIELDQAGVRGDGLAFSPEERAMAQSITLNVSGGNVNVVTHSTSFQIKQNASVKSADVTELVNALRGTVPLLRLPSETMKIAATCIKELRDNSAEGQVEKGVVQKTLSGLMDCVKDATSGILKETVTGMIANFMRQHGIPLI